MAFVGQLYASEFFLLGKHKAVQFYVCDDCRVTYGNQANDRVPIHMEILPPSARLNSSRAGLKSASQPLRYIDYASVDDSMDQWTFQRRRLTEAELCDKHLRRDKIGGLFPYGAIDCPRITPRNRIVAQFKWRGINGPVYLYESATEGVYLYRYR